MDELIFVRLGGLTQRFIDDFQDRGDSISREELFKAIDLMGNLLYQQV